ncbi:MAG: protoporphyrinogen oxidase HemJ [Rhodospirillaceae bacterium]|nr:protoporphyrinogen oxidase HemJ [Rhodospirillaceae bacterium]
MYDWLVALHVISVIAWMAGLFYLPRLFVYHAQTPPGSETSETFKVMERKLLRIIMNPAMIAAWAFGLLALWAQPAWLQDGWMHVKLTGVALMTAAHMAMAAWRRSFAEDRNTRSHRFYRYMNEIPTVLMIVIVIMVVVKPL